MKQHISKAQLSKVLLPPVDTIIDGKYKIIYINYMQLRITCKSKDFPDMGSILEVDDKLFKVCHFNFGENRFSAEFIGFKENPLPDVPEEAKDEVVNLLDND